jgi:transcriptional regulator with XRE-family HTH domain
MLIMLSKVKEYREKQFLTLMELRDASGVAIGSIWNAEQGRPVSTTTAKKLAKGLGIKPEQLV